MRSNGCWACASIAAMAQWSWRGRIWILVALGAPWLGGCAASAANPDKLWQIVHDQCVPAAASGAASPCVALDLSQGEARGFAVLRDIRGVAQHLLIPTRRLTGIDSPELLEPGAPNYWAAAWQSRRLLEAALGRALPRDAVALVVNSVVARSQLQLHIHIDCLRSAVRDALRAHAAEIGTQWSAQPIPLEGHDYRALRLEREELGDADPFRLLADGIPAARAAMGDQTLVLVGATSRDGKPGFILLNDHVDLARQDAAGGEELVDHDCAIAK